MKKRVSIYIDEEAWGNLKDHAWAARKSASAYLEGLITGDIAMGNQATIPELASINQEVVAEALDEISEEQRNILEAAQERARLKKEAADREIAKTKGFFNPTPKAKQVGKKGWR